jgi:hypothetical protein
MPATLGRFIIEGTKYGDADAGADGRSIAITVTPLS